MYKTMGKSAQQKAAIRFARTWKGRGAEKSDCQTFWLTLLRDVFGVEQPEKIIEFELPVEEGDFHGYIDAYISSTRVLIEQKSIGKNLDRAEVQSYRQSLKPYQQAKRYANSLPYSKKPRWIVLCNFSSFWVYDMDQPGQEPVKIELDQLESEYWRLQFLVDSGNEQIQAETQVSLKAGEIVGRLYDAILKCYINPDDPATLRSLNILCVRLVFCLYAEDAGVFGRRNMFHDYLIQYTPEQMRIALIGLFRVLDTPESKRDPYISKDLAAFPYVNGGLFAEENIEIPRFNDEIADLLLNHASADFDWSRISPTIFGAVFESTLNPQTRRTGGMHYTSIENIHKVIDPLFLDDLRRELNAALRLRALSTRRTRLEQLRQKMASLHFLDPACGSGNFLTETYLSLRRMENKILAAESKRQTQAGGDFSPIRVSIGQFYGIELNDFAVAVARTALWIAELQMMQETELIVGYDLKFLPLKSYPNIAEGNALSMDWNELCPREQMNYVMGNPPFSGARIMKPEQKDDLKAVMPGWKNVGNLDYVCGWYKKAADYMAGTPLRAALVSSNSITQGEQVSLLWKPLAAQGVCIDFARRTFRWDSEASQKARVHCVVVGFSCSGGEKEEKKLLFDEEGKPKEVAHINGYLSPQDDIYVESRTRPLCDVPEIGIGNKPIDGGNYLFTAEEKDAFLKVEPAAAPYFRPWYGAEEFIHRRPRYCLWLGDCSPDKLRKMPRCMERVKAVRELRLKSKSPGTVKLADKPTRFHVENMPEGNFIVIPETSSERREYVPIGFMPSDVFCSNAIRIIPSATLYHFGVLSSRVHMAWMRAVAGRLEMRYRYSKEIVYNNFPWPAPTAAQRVRIEQTAQAVLDARAQYPDASLADLYDVASIPPALREAHSALDRVVLSAYGWASNTEEMELVARLLAMYEKLLREV